MIKGLPKIALARLKAGSGKPKPSGAPEAPAGSQGPAHVDANLLAAFAEKALTENERTQVLSHLAQCAECREVVAFTMPAGAAVTEAARREYLWTMRPQGTRRFWTPWTVLRWGAIAAALCGVTLVVVLHPALWKGRLELSKETRPAPPASPVATANRAVPEPATPPVPASASPNAQAQGKPSEGLAEAKKAPPPLGLNRQAEVTRTNAQQQTSPLMMAARAPAASPSESGATGTERSESLGAKREETHEENENAEVRALAREPLPAPGTSADVTAPSPEVETRAESSAGSSAAHASSQGVVIAAGSAGGVSPPAAAENAAPRITVRSTGHAMSLASVRALQAPGAPAAVWRVGEGGQLERSTDGGKTFEEIQVAHGVELRAVAALGIQVWTAGTGGALFHSVDRGATWNRVAIAAGGNAVTETITGIRFDNPWQLTITTASGTQWATGDIGQHWWKLR
jgi:hypothetical protein